MYEQTKDSPQILNIDFREYFEYKKNIDEIHNNVFPLFQSKKR